MGVPPCVQFWESNQSWWMLGQHSGIQPHRWSASLEHCYLKEHHTVFGIFHSPLLFNVNPICAHSSLVLRSVDDHVTCVQSCSLPRALVNKPFIDTFSFLLKWGPVGQIWVWLYKTLLSLPEEVTPSHSPGPIFPSQPFPILAVVFFYYREFCQTGYLKAAYV